jgi:hypothetical protein
MERLPNGLPGLCPVGRALFHDFLAMPNATPNREFEKLTDGCAVRTNPLARGTLRVS